jgi:vancomycin permeability regulator SanA
MINPVIKKMLWTFLTVTVTFIIVIEFCNIWVERQTQARTYSDINEVPEKR